MPQSWRICYFDCSLHHWTGAIVSFSIFNPLIFKVSLPVCARSTCTYVSTAHQGSSATSCESSSLFLFTPSTLGSASSSSPMTSTMCTSTPSETVMRVRKCVCLYSVELSLWLAVMVQFCEFHWFSRQRGQGQKKIDRLLLQYSAQEQFLLKAKVIMVAPQTSQSHSTLGWPTIDILLVFVVI